MSIISGTSAATSQATTAQQSQDKLEEDLNAFLELLVTQLQNQDPLEPMDSTEFTNQLVQFASVEQQIYQNSNLEMLLEATYVNQVAGLSGYLGTTIEGAGDTFNLENGSATFTYDMAGDAVDSQLFIRDANGKVVYTTKGEYDAGKHTFTWDGVDDDGVQLEDGAYSFQLAALDSDGEPIDYAPTVFGNVTSAGAEDGVVTLYMGDVPMQLGFVQSVSESKTTTPAPTE